MWWKEPFLSHTVSVTPGVQRLSLERFSNRQHRGSFCRSVWGRREAGVGQRHFHPQSLLASFSSGPGRESYREREGETERETAPSTSPLTYISTVAFFALFLFFCLLFLLYQHLHNCDVMTKASVIKSQTGQDETLLKRSRQKKETKKRRDSERQIGRGLKCRRG